VAAAPLIKNREIRRKLLGLQTDVVPGAQVFTAKDILGAALGGLQNLVTQRNCGNSLLSIEDVHRDSDCDQKRGAGRSRHCQSVIGRFSKCSYEIFV
jgi:hypothetical protein